MINTAQRIMPSGKSKSRQHPNGFRRTVITDSGQKKALAPRSLRSGNGERRFIDQVGDVELKKAGISRRKRVTGGGRYGEGKDSGTW